jgi:hypothetical protein
MLLNVPNAFPTLLDLTPNQHTKTARMKRKGHAAKAVPKIAYLISRYPAVSHTFILREVKRLRQLGFEIGVASINRPDRAEQEMTQQEKNELRRT